VVSGVGVRWRYSPVVGPLGEVTWRGFLQLVSMEVVSWKGSPGRGTLERFPWRWSPELVPWRETSGEEGVP
jgi:hypothetical protein